MRRLVAALLLLPGFGFAQYSDIGSWNILNIRYIINDKWGLFGEAQLRSLKFYSDFHYYEYKGGISYDAGKQLKLALGAGSYQTYKEGGNFVKPKNNNEFRLWPQVMLIQPVGRLKIEQRYRAEFRFTSNGYRNRFRYRLGLAYPFGKLEEKERPFQLSLANEIFFTDREPYFERNRLLLALNVKLNGTSSLQAGYLHQFDYRINDETGRDFFLVGYYIGLSKKKTAKQLPATGLNEN